MFLLFWYYIGAVWSLLQSRKAATICYLIAATSGIGTVGQAGKIRRLLSLCELRFEGSLIAAKEDQRDGIGPKHDMLYANMYWLHIAYHSAIISVRLHCRGPTCDYCSLISPQAIAAVEAKVDVINFSYGEASHWTNRGWVRWRLMSGIGERNHFCEILTTQDPNRPWKKLCSCYMLLLDSEWASCDWEKCDWNGECWKL